MLGAVLSRCDAADPLEGGGEGERAAVADLVGDGRDRGVWFEQQVGRERDAPAGEEGHRGVAYELVDAPADDGARGADVVGELGDGPGAFGLVVPRAQCGCADRVGAGPVPARV